VKNTILEVNRTNHGETRRIEENVEPLEPGQVRLRVDRFALTANNITYAVAGDMLGYWDFFPTADGWGRVPAMGWADIIESTHPDIAEGGRYYGWFPMAQYVTITARKISDGFRDDGDHRAAHAAVYRNYVHTAHDPWYETGDGAEDRHALLRGLFLTGFLADEFFADDNYFGADQVVVMSASSKTAIGFSQRAAARAGLKVVAVTSPSNKDFVAALGIYDQVLAYGQLDDIANVSSVCIDMAGNAGVRAAIHDRLQDNLAYSMTVGLSHHDAPPAEVTAGPRPQMFFAPTEVARRRADWGPAAYEDRTTQALTEFVTESLTWLEIEATNGPELAEMTWADVYNGEVAPSVGRIVSLHHQE
jgi:NADPH:quinone reductase-like Zn-dependent oxidoreductase